MVFTADYYALSDERSARRSRLTTHLGGPMDAIVQDLRYAVRSLRRQPAFALLAIATLALGIGANAAIFSAVDAVLLRPLAYRHPDRIVALSNYWLKTGRRGTVSAPDFHDWHDSTTSFAAMGYYTYAAGGETSVIVDGVAEYGNVVLVTPEFFDVFGVDALAGRTIGRSAAAGDAPVAVIGHELWQRRFGGSPAALGRTVSFGQRAVTIVGIMPPGFGFPDRTDIWYFPDGSPETASRSAHNYRVVARLKDDRTVAQAQAELSSLAARLSAAYPATNEGKSAAVVPLREQLVGDTRPTLYLLFGAVGLVLLIACANVANLLLARATGRTSELAVRAALGAGRTRIVAQLMTESLLLAVVSAAAGLALARWGVAAFVALAPAGLPRAAEIGIDWRVLAFALAASIGASVLFGVLPALHASRVDLNLSLRQGGRGAAAGGSGGRFRGMLVVAEVALAVALVVGAALLVRSFTALGRVELGYAADRVLVVRTSVPSRDLDGARRATATYASLLPRLAALPGVDSVAGVTGLPGSALHSNGGYWLEGGPGPEVSGVQAPQAVFTVVTPDYFRTMAIPVRGGRDFSDRDGFDAPMVAIVNEALARQAFPGVDPIGRQIMCGLDSLKFMTIVGVTGNVREYDPSVPPLPELYMPYRQHPFYGSSLTLVARTGGEPLALANAFRETIRTADPDVPVRATTMTEMVSASVATPRFRTLLVGTFAALALLLAMAGVYGVMAYAVSRRTAEIGVRMAMGATAADILRLVMGQGLRLAIAGIVIGSALAYALAQLLRGMLFAVAPADPLVFGAVPVALILTVAAATAIPALRASRVDPMTALRAD
jgi:putative ABC transport system permease protein